MSIHNNRSSTETGDGFIKTSALNFISRKAFIHGPVQVSIKGKTIISPNCHIRGDLAPVRIGRYCFIDSGSVLRPPFVEEARSLESNTTSSSSITATIIPDSSVDKDGTHDTTISNNHQKQSMAISSSSSHSNIGTFVPLHIGNHTKIGQNCVIEAAAIGSSVIIGNNAILCKRVIIKDCVYIDDYTVVPPDMVIPPFSRVSGCPAKISTDSSLPESVAVEFVQDSLERYSSFVKYVESAQSEIKTKNG